VSLGQYIKGLQHHHQHHPYELKGKFAVGLFLYFVAATFAECWASKYFSSCNQFTPFLFLPTNQHFTLPE
jgi:hypothetical protein